MMWLVLKDSISSNFENEEGYTYIFPMNKINFFVGKNNSGKSRFLRFIMQNTVRIYNDEKELKKYICDALNGSKDMVRNIFNTGIKEIDEIKRIHAEYLNMLNKIKESKGDMRGQIIGLGAVTLYKYKDLDELIKYTMPLINFLGLTCDRDGSLFDTDIVPKFEEISDKIYSNQIKEICEYISQMKEEHLYKLGKICCIADKYNSKNSNIQNKFFVPTIRGLRNPLKNIQEKSIGEDIYRKRIALEYSIDENNIKIISGLDMYSMYKNNLLGSKEKRARITEFENFLSEYFFDGANISIVPDEETFELKINIDDDEEDRFIYEVGDGISSLIIIAYTMFIEACDYNWNIFFIDEPENSFHPGFQRLLISIISRYKAFGKCICFFTTHSNHLIDIGVNEMQNSNVYLCKKNKNETEICYQGEEFNEVLDELGVQASSVRIANKVIWVEGKYDAFYIRMLLKLHETESTKKYIEDYDYCFVPYGGANMKLINFTKEDDEIRNEEFITKANKINSKFLVILDDDEMGKDKKTKKYQRYVDLKEKLGDKIYKLDVREIENLFPEEVVRNFIIDGMVDKSKMDMLDINYNDYKGCKLGDYINRTIKDLYESDDLKALTNRKDGFVADGFLYSKPKFYEKVLKWSKKEDFNFENDVPDEAKKLVEIVERFIEG